ncbi:MAG: sensor histidine kinase [Gemmatimonadaceae bacterium]
MTAFTHDSPIEPLFAQNARLWRRIWLATQGVATLVATWVELEHTGPSVQLGVLVAALVVYHVAGALAHAWILRRTWTVLLFVPVGWVLVLAALKMNGAFGLLVLGAILEGFIFLPFAWAAVTLAIVVAALGTGVGIGASQQPPAVMLARVGIVLATGVMIATVLLYIHRANRETALRTRLLDQLAATQRDLAERARDAGIVEERQRLSRDIHDTLAQAFTSIIKHLETVELALGDTAHDPAATRALERVKPHLAHAQDASRASLAEIRQVLHALRPVALNDAPLAAALERVVREWGAANDVRTTFQADALPPLLPDADVIFLRATQESLSNVSRHAHASLVAVTIAVVDELVLLTIDDDGRGFAPGDAMGAEKLGLTGMRERVRRFGGHVLVDSEAGKGTSLTVALPTAAVVDGVAT